MQQSSFAHGKNRDEPGKCQPRGLRRRDAALYIGVSPTTFDRLVKEGTLPQPLRFNGVVVWDRYALDRIFDDYAPEPIDANPWDTAEALATGERREVIPSPERHLYPTVPTDNFPSVSRRIPSSARDAFRPLEDFLDGKALY